MEPAEQNLEIKDNQNVIIEINENDNENDKQRKSSKDKQFYRHITLNGIALLVGCSFIIGGLFCFFSMVMTLFVYSDLLLERENEIKKTNQIILDKNDLTLESMRSFYEKQLEEYSAINEYKYMTYTKESEGK